MTELSPAAKELCEDNYASNCGRCPLRLACVQNVGPGREAYDRCQGEVNTEEEILVNK